MDYHATMKRLLLWAALLTCTALHAQSNDLESWTNDYIQSLSPAHPFRGNVLVERDGHVALEKSFGLADESWKIPNAKDGRFEIASLSKQFTAAAILQLVEAGKVSLDDPISKYYAKSPVAWRSITIHELLTHTSGLPNNTLQDFKKGIASSYTPEELIETFRDRPLLAAPGSKWAYTNTEYYLLAYIIEKLSGESYGAYLNDHVFKPLGMLHSGFASTLTIIPNMTEGYIRENGILRHRDYFDRSLEIGAGGIYSTTEDLLLWNHALDTPGFLTAHSLELMFTAHPPGNYGYGWFVEQKPVRRAYHEGGDPGFAAFETRYPDQQLLIVVLANEDGAPVRDISLEIAKHLGIGAHEVSRPIR